MEQTLVFLVDVPQTLREIVRDVLSNEHDLVVDEPDRDTAAATIRTSGACVVITRLEDSARVSMDRFFGTRTHVRILALSTDGVHGAVYELQPEERLLGEMSPPVLLAAIRDPLA